jgi:hypothetical protein
VELFHARVVSRRRCRVALCIVNWRHRRAELVESIEPGVPGGTQHRLFLSQHLAAERTLRRATYGRLRSMLAVDNPPLRSSRETRSIGSEHVTFNHGVEGSSPSALTKRPHYRKGLFNFTTQGTTQKTHLGSVWVVG